MKLKAKLVLVLIAMYSIFSVAFTVTWIYLLADNEEKTDIKIKAEFLETSFNAINNIAETYFQLISQKDFTKTQLDAESLFIENLDGYIFLTNYSGDILNSNKLIPDDIKELISERLISDFVNEYYIKNTKEFSVDNYEEVMRNSGGEVIPIKVNFIVFPEQEVLLAYGQLMYSTMARVDALNNLVVSNNRILSITGIVYLLLSLTILVVTVWSFFSYIVDRPLQRIVKALKFNSKKEVYAPLLSQVKDEIGEISRAIDTLQKSQNELLNKFKQSEHNLIQIIDLIPSSIFARDIEGTYLIANKHAANQCNLSVSELIGRNANTILENDPDSIKYLTEDQSLIRSNEPIVIDNEYQIETPKGKQWTRVVKMPYFPAGGSKAVLCILTDISRVKNAEQNLQELNRSLESKIESRTELLAESNHILQSTLDELQVTQEELIQKEKMASLSVLTAGMAHELNTPLGVCLTASTNMSSVLEDLKQAFEDSKLTKVALGEFLGNLSESSDLISKNLTRAADLISNFKKLASNQAQSDIEKFDLILLINDTLLTFRNKFEKLGIQVSFSHDSLDSLMIVSYVGSYTQILTNLISNSFVHGQMVEGQGEIELEVFTKNDSVYLVYGDNGAGVDDATASKLFDPFYTTKRTQGGTGLGLHIVATLVENSLAGKIQSKVTEGKGLSFLIESKMDVSKGSSSQ